jgi:GNAT superfamily N-acetyltransferase
MTVQQDVEVRPLTVARWPDLEAVFTARGCTYPRSCWCMYFRRSGAMPALPSGMTYSQVNRSDLKALAANDPPPGLIGYRSGLAVGWVALGPREHYRRLERSPIMKRVDELPVWSIVCFVVPPAYRGQGIAHGLLAGAVEFARERGVEVLEAYPVDKPSRSPDDTIWYGPRTLFDAAGFQVVARRKPTRPVMRLRLR